MNRRILSPTAMLPLLLVSLTLVSACGGGGGGGGGGGTVIPPVLTATFTADNPAPGPTTLSMTPGNSSAAAFEVQVMVTGIADFYGAAFHVHFDPATASFAGLVTPAPPTSVAESFIFGFGFGLDFRAVQLSPGVIAVNATRQGLINGVASSATPQLLVTLGFTATNNTALNAFSFDSPAPGGVADFREVQTCATAVNPCVIVAESGLTWSGGALTTN